MQGRRDLRGVVATAASATVIAFFSFGCQPRPGVPDPIAHPNPPPPKVWKWELLKVYPHDPTAFIQGLLWHEGALYESLGLYGESAVRRVDLLTGKTLAEARLDNRHFGEGLALVGEDLVQLTWQEGTAFVWDRASLRLKRTLSYPGEGWGLVSFGDMLILSDGTDILRALDPASFRLLHRIAVRSDNGPVARLNELERVGELLLANIYLTDTVAVIDPRTGALVGRIDFSEIFPASERPPGTDVLNGLAWREETKTLLVTGKRWPLLFEVRLIPPE